MDYIARLFTQNATWNEVIPSASSLSEETTEVHALDCVRFSVESVGTGSDTNGIGNRSGSVLYWLVGKSTVDGRTETPAFKSGDTIETPSHTWTIVSVSDYASLRKGQHHLEISLV